MEFCKKCDNIYYINLTQNGKIIYKCKKCKNTEELDDENNSNLGKRKKYLIKTNIQTKSLSYDHIINDYTCYDNTLPRITHINCPNPECSRNIKKVEEGKGEKVEKEEKEEKDIIFIRYDDINLKYVYLCTTCKKVF